MSSVRWGIIRILTVTFIVTKRVKSIICETIRVLSMLSLYASHVKCTWFTSIACVLSANITFQWTVVLSIHLIPNRSPNPISYISTFFISSLIRSSCFSLHSVSSYGAQNQS